MKRFLPLIFLLATAALLAQDPEGPTKEQAPDSAEESQQDVADDLGDLDELDELYPVEDEDEFIPSEDVAFGQSIPFPTDI